MMKVNLDSVLSPFIYRSTPLLYQICFYHKDLTWVDRWTFGCGDEKYLAVMRGIEGMVRFN